MYNNYTKMDSKKYQKDERTIIYAKIYTSNNALFNL